MSKKPPEEPIRGKTIRLPASMWDEIDAVRRTMPGRVPSEPMAVRMLVRRALDLFARPRWRPIETAPKDGTVVDLWYGDQRYPNCEWDRSYASLPEQFCGWAQNYAERPGSTYPLPPGFRPTHWRPLPEPPGAE